MKLGYIDYLNCFPFYYHMFEKQPLDGVEILPAYPGELNQMMRNGDLDLSPISSAAFADVQSDVLVLPYFCLSSIGYVRSVVLNSKLPIENLNGKKVGLTSASQTSVVLLKVLLEKYYQVSPEYVTVSPSPEYQDIDAALVIGNEAMIEPAEPVAYTYDLGDLWIRKTGHPVVFAVFVVRKESLEKYPEDVKDVIASYSISLQELRTNEAGVVEKAALKYPAIHYDIGHYYELLKFDFTPALKDALRFYFDEAASLGLLEPVVNIDYYE